MFELLEADELGRRLAAAGSSGIALDIDDTLCMTDLRWFEVMAERHSNPEGLTGRELLERYRNVFTVPYWDSPEGHAAILGYVYDDLFHETFQPVSDAVSGVNELSETVPLAAYITARPATLADTTASWLRRHGFPAAPLVMRPPGGEHRAMHAWKADVLCNLHPHVTGIVDDAPALMDELLARGYAGRQYVFDHGVHGKEYGNAARYGTWAALVADIRAHRAAEATG